MNMVSKYHTLKSAYALKLPVYKLHHQGLHWYVIPADCDLERLPYPENFPKRLLYSSAKSLMDEMEISYIDGYKTSRYDYVFSNLEKEKFNEHV